MNLWKKRSSEPTHHHTDPTEPHAPTLASSPTGDPLDTPLLHFSPDDPFTVRESLQGISILGGTGSGKTTGSAAAIAKAMLRAGYGGIVCCAKPEEKDLWLAYAQATGRLEDVIIFSPDHPWRFNFLDFEMRRKGRGVGTENAVALLSHIVALAEGSVGQKGGDNRFWERAMNQMLRNTIDLLSLADETISLEHISRIITSAPLSMEQTRDKAWAEDSFCMQCLIAARQSELDNTLTPLQSHDFQIVYRYWMDYARLDERTRSNITATLTGVMDGLLHGIIYELFCTTTTLTPSDAFTGERGRIIILDMPVQEFHDLGVIGQGIFKYCFQREVLRRDVKQHPIPCYIWLDESQYFLGAGDSEFKFQAVARSSRVSCCFITQSVSNIYSVMRSHDEAHALLANLKTMIFHSQGDAATNAFASRTIGDTLLPLGSWNTNQNTQGGSIGAGGSYGIHPKILPEKFTRLKEGGPPDWQVEAVIFKSGRIWKQSGDTWLYTLFNQNRPDAE